MHEKSSDLKKRYPGFRAFTRYSRGSVFLEGICFTPVNGGCEPVPLVCFGEKTEVDKDSKSDGFPVDDYWE
jgi:hypothetical protein